MNGIRLKTQSVSIATFILVYAAKFDQVFMYRRYTGVGIRELSMSGIRIFRARAFRLFISSCFLFTSEKRVRKYDKFL